MGMIFALGVRGSLALLVSVALGVGSGCAMDTAGSGRSHDDADRAEVSALLDTLHASASRADFEAYFTCYHPGAVFLGTDATERWSVDEFKAYAKPHFDAGRGWTYAMTKRHIDLFPGGPGAGVYFDELLENAKYGTCRGSGVVLRDKAGQWKVIQYNLAFTVPNDAAEEVAAVSRRVHDRNKGEPKP